jgi:23S rRNA (uracil1939-C5)-methyltransferase
VEPITIIDNLSHDGRGIARINGKTTFLFGGLPGEKVQFRYTRKKKDYDEGVVEAVLEPSPQRATPLCAHYDRCGGCTWQHLQPSDQITMKQGLTLDLIRRIGRCEPEYIAPPLSSSPWGYRQKARLSVKYIPKEQRVLIGFRERFNPKYVTDVKICHVLDPDIGMHIEEMRACIASLSRPGSIAQIEYAKGNGRSALIIRHMEPLDREDKDKVHHLGHNLNMKIFLQSAGLESVFLEYDPDPKSGGPDLSYTLLEENLTFNFMPYDFTQVNADINQAMVNQALEWMDIHSSDRILDLFCGLGNFSLPLAKHAAYVFGIEGSELMVTRAKENARLNRIHNIRFEAMNLDKPSSVQEIWREQYDKLLLDPSRMGAWEVVSQLPHFKKIVYISCNPATFARDAGCLVHEKGFRFSKLCVMDMFPQTNHVELMAVFDKES